MALKKTAVKKTAAVKAAEEKPVKTVKKTVKKSPKKAKSAYCAHFDLKKTDALLDLGCGAGDFLKEVLDDVKTAVGLDCDQTQLAAAHELLKDSKKVNLVECWLQDANFEGGSFDKVSMRNVIRNLNNHEKGVLVHKVNHWLKPGGIFVVEDMITSFGLHRKDERHEMIEEECKNYYGPQWGAVRDNFYRDLYHGNPGDLSLMMHHFLFTGFNILKIIKHTSCLCTIVAQK